MTRIEQTLRTLAPYDAFRWAEDLFEHRDYYSAATVLQHLVDTHPDERRTSRAPASCWPAATSTPRSRPGGRGRPRPARARPGARVRRGAARPLARAQRRRDQARRDEARAARRLRLALDGDGAAAMADYGHELEFGLFPTPDAARLDDVLELGSSPRSAGSTSSRCRTTRTRPPPRHLDAAVGDRRAHQHDHGSRPTSRTCRCAARSCWPRPRPRSTSSAAAGSSSASAPARSGTPSRPRAACAVRPGEAVDALEEAIGSSARSGPAGSVRFDGEHHRRGRAARRARARRTTSRSGSAPTSRGCCALTGRLADGWLPSMGYADPPALAGLNARIDEAAVAAGRAPGGRPAALQRLRPLRLRRRLPAGDGRRLGRAARRARPSSRA